MICLEYLFPKVIKGGLIILDDYHVWDGCSKALHDYLSKYKCSERIMDAYHFLYPKGKGAKLTGCFLIKN
jgi:hypothetical protein